VLAQIVDALRPLPPAQIVGAANDRQRERRRQPHCDHVIGDELAQPDASVKPLGRDVDQLLACGEFHLDLRISFAERRDERLQQDRYHRARHRKAQQSGWPLSKVARDLAGGD
jgi:hypothetical protein